MVVPSRWERGALCCGWGDQETGGDPYGGFFFFFDWWWEIVLEQGDGREYILLTEGED